MGTSHASVDYPREWNLDDLDSDRWLTSKLDKNDNLLTTFRTRRCLWCSLSTRKAAAKQGFKGKQRMLRSQSH